jgi:hypothetical protein
MSPWDTPAAIRDYLTLAGVVRTSEAEMLNDSSSFYLNWGVWSHFFILLQYASYVLKRKKSGMPLGETAYLSLF